MTTLRSALVVAVALVLAMALFWSGLHQIASVWLDVALRPEVSRALEHSMEDQRRLRALDPGGEATYRQRFEESRKLLNRIEVIRHNRAAVVRRYELLLVALFGLVSLALAVWLWLRQRRARARERREYVNRVNTMQETARRHVHEIKGPLTAARLEIDRFAETVRRGAAPAEVEMLHASILEELDRLTRYTREVSTFSALGQPIMRRESLGEIVEEFRRTFASAWRGLDLLDGDGDASACADRDMVRQVLVNLCTNSMNAGAHTVTLTVRHARGNPCVDVTDDGPGIAPSVRPRLFDPYVTTRSRGEGMGLGLSISRKVMIGHGGDLQLVESAPGRTTFRLLFRDDRERPCS
jgi:signal transduction histidine kinase